MAYDPDTPPSLLVQGVGGSVGLRFYAHTWLDPIADVLAPGYITNAQELGMRPGDAFRYTNLSLGQWADYHLIVADVTVDGIATLGFPDVPEEAIPYADDVDPSDPGNYVIMFSGGRQVRVDSVNFLAGEGTVMTSSEAQAKGGTNNDTRMSPLRTRQAINLNFAADRAAIKLLDPAVVTSVSLAEPGREGVFVWRAGDYAARVAADTAEGIYIKATDIAATVGAWVRDYRGAVDIAWFGVAPGNNPGPMLATLFAAYSHVSISIPGTYTNTTTAITLPLGKTLVRGAGVDLKHSGSGSFNAKGTVVTFGENPSGINAWDNNGGGRGLGFNFTGVTADIGGYGPTKYSIHPVPSAITGTVSAPADSAYWHAQAIAGYAKSATTLTPPVGVYAESNAGVAGINVFGMNPLCNDNGFAATLIGIEVDINIKNTASNAIGLYLIGDSLGEGTGFTKAIEIAPIGISGPFRWDVGTYIQNGAVKIALSAGALGLAPNTASSSIEWRYVNGSGADRLGGQVFADTMGNTHLQGNRDGGALYLESWGSGVYKTNIGMAAGLTSINGAPFEHPLSVLGSTKLNGQVGFQGNNPMAKPTVSGSQGGNAALISLIAALTNYGLINNLTTA